MKMQIEMQFDRKFSNLKEAIVHSVFKSDTSIKTLACKLDHSPSNLSRRLNLVKVDGEPCLSVEDFEGIMEATGDYTPIYYLLERFVQKDQDRLLKEFDEFKKKIPDLKRFIMLAEGKK
jgi:hypothetical protein